MHGARTEAEVELAVLGANQARKEHAWLFMAYLIIFNYIYLFIVIFFSEAVQ